MAFAKLAPPATNLEESSSSYSVGNKMTDDNTTSSGSIIALSSSSSLSDIDPYNTSDDDERVLLLDDSTRTATTGVAEDADLLLTSTETDVTPTTTTTTTLPKQQQAIHKPSLLSLASLLWTNLCQWVVSLAVAILRSKLGAAIIKTRVVDSWLNTLPPGAASLMASMMESSQAHSRYSSAYYTLPQRSAVMQLAQLDKEYYAGLGDRLWYYNRRQGKNKPQEVIDFVGGYGTNLLGHGHPELKATAEAFLQGPAISLSDQGSMRRQGEYKLAEMLSKTVSRELRMNNNNNNNKEDKEFVVRLGSTGAEAVEMALAHACLEREERVQAFLDDQRCRFGALCPVECAQIESQVRDALLTQKPKVIVLKNCFHGKTLGARCLIGNASTRAPFSSMMGIEPIMLPTDGQVDVEHIIEQEMFTAPALQLNKSTGKPEMTGEHRFNRIVAAFAEPILGEGGVCLPDRSLLARLHGYDFPLIFDEIQCGLGRSGKFLASQGLKGDYYVFAKALGGGIAKISALLVARERYIHRFDDLFSSTFSGDNFSCAVAQQVLTIIRRDNIPRRAKERGQVLRATVDALQNQYPEIIKAVTGQGLMMGVEINTAVTDHMISLRYVAAGNRLGWAIASYLLNRQNLRLLPTVSAPNVLRLEPSAFIDDEAIEALRHGLTQLCEAIQRRDFYELFGFIVDGNQENLAVPPMELPPFSCDIEKPHPGAQRVLFVSHSVVPEIELQWMYPDLRGLNPLVRVELFRQTGIATDHQPFILFARNLFQNKVWFINVLVPFDAVQMAAAVKGEGKAKVLASLEQALRLGASHGCTIGVLGAFTSIVSNNGMALQPPPGMHVSTGNSFTVAVGMQRLQDTCKEKKIDLHHPNTRVAIIGATGNIGRSIAQQIVRKLKGVSRLTLISRSRDKLDKVRQQLLSIAFEEDHTKTCEIEVSTDIMSIRECNIIIVATATGEPIVFPHHLHPEFEIVVADLSVPSSVSREAQAMSNVYKIPIGGTVAVPGEPDFVLAPFIEPGNAFCCSAEGMLLGLEPEKTKSLNLTGDISQSSVDVLHEIADRYGFFAKLGEGMDFGLRSGGRKP